MVLVDPQRGEGSRELQLPHRSQASRWPPQGLSGAVLTAGGGHADDTGSGIGGQCHQPSGEIGLVVGVRPHGQHSPQFADVGGAGPLILRSLHGSHIRVPSVESGSSLDDEVEGRRHRRAVLGEAGLGEHLTESRGPGLRAQPEGAGLVE